MISIVVGSTTEITIKQIAYLENRIKDNKLFYKDIMLYYLDKNEFNNIKDGKFLHNIAKSDILIMSGGETAYSLLSSSGFKYLMSRNQIMPLISTGIIKGGLFNNKLYIIKGGSLGGVDIYDIMIKYARNNFNRKKENA